jgi:hypothetical protein
MDPNFLFRLQKLHARKENAPEGISIDDLPSDELAFNDYSKVMVIPSGLTKETLNNLTRLGSHVADCVDRDYPEESIEMFSKLSDHMRPSVIIAGSRGTVLISEFLKKLHFTDSTTDIVLFGPVHLREFFEACSTTCPYRTFNILVVHGIHDTNERITTVRSNVQEFKATLVEMNQGHGLNIQYDSLHKLINFNKK